MDRQLLDRLYRGARGNPSRVFRRAISDAVIDTDTYGFIVEHASELDINVLLGFLGSEFSPDINVRPRPFLRRLVELFSHLSLTDLDFLRLLKLAGRIEPAAWIEDLTVPLAGRIPKHLWYRLVDKARGGVLFNSLNTGMPTSPDHPDWNPDESFFPPIEEQRPEPVVVGILEQAHNDRAVAEFALKTQPVGVLLQLHRRFPELVPAAAIQAILPERAARAADNWLPQDGAESLPNWLAPWVPRRLECCDAAEARALYEWLFSEPRPESVADPLKLALLRFRIAVSATPLDPAWTHWCPHIAEHLTTGSAWKSQGRELIAVCIDLGKGFPPQVLDAAIESVQSEDEAAREKHERAILRRVHDETAHLLVERAERAIAVGDLERADLYLSAFLSLDPGSFIRGALHHLGKRPGLSPELSARVDACKALAGAGHRNPTKEAFLEAFLVLTGQAS